MFLESVTALIRVADSYATPRSKYFGTTDAFFSYLDDHLAVLMAATAKAPNQYLITNVVTATGAIGRIALRLGGLTDKDKSTTREATPSSSTGSDCWPRALI